MPGSFQRSERVSAPNRRSGPQDGGGTRSWAHYGARALVRHPEDPTKKLSSLAEVTVTTSPIYLLGDARPVAPGQPAHHPGRHRRFDGRRREFGTPHHHP